VTVTQQSTLIVYGITDKDGSGYNRLVPSEDEN
jgi:hypothetical protein